VIGKLAKGDDAIYLYGYLELTNMGRRLPCWVLFSCGATGVFTNAAFAEELGTTFYQLENPVPVQNIDGTEN
jgi:hypothetical protein